MERVYRFRSTDRLLGSSQELEKQEIYFAHPSELNDPAEGIFPFVWEGDKIIWTNFFQHYLYCFHCKCLDFAVMGDHAKIAGIPPPMMGGRGLAFTTVMSQIHGNVIQKVFNDPNVEKLVKVLAQSKHQLDISGVLFLFRVFHRKAIGAIRDVHQELGYPLDFLNVPIRDNPLDGFPGVLESMMRTNSASTLIIIWESIFGNKACFPKNCSNAASWASYGDNHKGVCLIFGEKHDSKGPGLTLNTRSHNVGNDTQRNTSHHKFYNVNYGQNIAKINFFAP